ncbi:MAG TPA: PaaI family thioesterase [Solirubrobacteraceae bacterium]|nr:PaaI family thioesterase [Solirubrobacteraceae bacterium]
MSAVSEPAESPVPIREGARRVRTIEWEDPTALVSGSSGLSGLETMCRIAAGEAPPPPIAKLLDMELVEVGAGRAVFALRPAEWMYNPIGSVHGGIAATILDSCMGCAVHTTLEAGVGYTTTDLQVRYLRAMREGGGRVLAEGRVVHAGRRTATAEGRLFLEEDETVLYAHGSTGCVILR